MDDIFEELYYQFVYLPKKDACPERTARWEPSSTVLPGPGRRQGRTGLQRLPHGLSGGVPSGAPSGTGPPSS